MDDFLSNNVNAFSGDVLLCDTYVLGMFPEIVASAKHGRTCFSYAPETTHIDQLGFKLCTALRLGRITSLDVLTKDGSPHAVQIPLIVQEAATNTEFSLAKVRFFVVEKGRSIQVSHASVRLARHLSEINAICETRSAEVVQRPEEETVPKAFVDRWISILLGGRKDIGRVQTSGMLAILDKMKIRYEVSIISSEQNPDELKTYCHSAAARNVSLFVCIAGLVPGLPAAVKAQLPAVPVIGVPLSGPEFGSRDILLASLSVPARRPIMLTGIDDTGLKKAAYLACDILACTSEVLRDQYRAFLKESTPHPDFHVDLSRPDSVDISLPHIGSPARNGNGRK